VSTDRTATSVDARLGTGNPESSWRAVWSDFGDWAAPIALVLVVWVVLEAVGLLALAKGPREPFGGDWQELIYRGPLSGVLSVWQRWDALWYQHIAETGYTRGDTAFFPLYPLAVRLASLFVVGNSVLGALIVSTTALTIGLRTIRRLASLEAARLVSRVRTATRIVEEAAIPWPTMTILAIATFPTAFFLFAPYTEALFLVLTAGSIYLSRTGRPWLAGSLGFLASLTRAQGIFLSFALAVDTLDQRKSVDWARRRGGQPPGNGFLASALPIVGSLSLVLFQRAVLGAESTGLDAQSAWGYRIVPPWESISAAIRFIADRPTNPQSGVEALNLLCLIGFSAIAVTGFRRLPPSYWAYMAPSLGLLLTREMYFSPLMSTARFAVVLFPCFMILGQWLAARPRFAMLWLVASFVGQLVLFQYFVRWGFVG
jgi:hypothetical protein